ncbi:MAG: 50S ribosomal protein L5 [Omnitrophica bacterium RIFCSPLOWO2_01_FULL_50_24]|nr:MAG: 50S ribosomal protein L5 [Omnitrophica bacterium RIFCSPLOWO2_01_FULL_50_24]
MAEQATQRTSARKTPKLLEVYRATVVPALIKEFSYKSPLVAPRIQKVVINMGVKEGAQDAKVLERLSQELALITGQKPVYRKAKKSISAFKLREGAPIGLKVTLRGNRMYEFVERLFQVAMPRIRDFRGFPDSSFDGQANLSIGLQEQSIFPEVELDKVVKIQGMDITFVTSTSKKEDVKRMFELMGFPFRK